MIEFEPPINKLYSTSDLAELLGIEPHSVSARARRRGIGRRFYSGDESHCVYLFTEADVKELMASARPHPLWTADELAILESAYHQGMNCSEIARALVNSGYLRSRQAVWQRLKRMGFDIVRLKRKPGPKRHWSEW